MKTRIDEYNNFYVYSDEHDAYIFAFKVNGRTEDQCVDDYIENEKQELFDSYMVTKWKRHLKTGLMLMSLLSGTARVLLNAFLKADSTIALQSSIQRLKKLVKLLQSILIW